MIEDFPESSLVADAYYALGAGFEDDGMHQDAIENFRKVVELGSSDLSGQAAIAIADIYAGRDKPDMALMVYDEIAERYPNLRGMVYPKEARVYASCNKPDEALGLYRKALDIVSVKELARVQFQMAEFLQSQGDMEAAIEAYLKVTYLYSDDRDLAVKALLRVAQMYEGKKLFHEAMVLYQRVVDLNVAEAKFARERMDSLASSLR